MFEVLSDASRPGKPKTFSPEQLVQVIAVACEEPGESDREISHWTRRELAEEVIQRQIVPSISPRHVGRLLDEADLKPHMSRYWLNNDREQDPEQFDAETKTVCDLYAAAPRLYQQGSRLVSMDEKALGPLGPTKIQLLEVLEAGPSYGYSMWRQLDVRFGERISLQAVYQHLRELYEMGLVEMESGGPSKNRGRKRNYYRLTRRGRRIFSSLDSIRDSLLEEGG